MTVLCSCIFNVGYEICEIIDNGFAINITKALLDNRIVLQNIYYSSEFRILHSVIFYYTIAAIIIAAIIIAAITLRRLS